MSTVLLVFLGQLERPEDLEQPVRLAIQAALDNSELQEQLD